MKKSLDFISPKEKREKESKKKKKSLRIKRPKKYKNILSKKELPPS